MTELKNKYETIFIVDSSKTEEEIASVVEKFKALIAENGEIESVDEWGKRRLAYPINDKNEGYYVLVNFKGVATLPSELERIFGITEGILRSIIIRLDEEKTAKAEA